jgi:hypothetical protein
MWRGRLFTMLATTFVWRKKFAAEVVVTRKGSRSVLVLQDTADDRGAVDLRGSSNLFLLYSVQCVP